MLPSRGWSISNRRHAVQQQGHASEIKARTSYSRLGIRHGLGSDVTQLAGADIVAVDDTNVSCVEANILESGGFFQLPSDGKGAHNGDGRRRLGKLYERHRKGFQRSQKED